jgi:ubiquinone/menaquinone biosynthesis C-methylase UbiE
VNEALPFPDHVVDRLHLIWGDGFLSPGGVDEVREIVRGLDLADKVVLDIGCGTAGPALVLVRDLGAARVVGIDIEPQLLERATRYIETKALSDRIALRLVEPGPLPFADSSFDVVFSKDSILHIADKGQLFRDVVRILTPGGVFAAGDWLAHENAHDLPEFARFIGLRGLTTGLATQQQIIELMNQAGLTGISLRDRTEWFADLTGRQADQIEGPLREELIGMVGESRYLKWARLRRACADAARCGGLRPTHLRAAKLRH